MKRLIFVLSTISSLAFAHDALGSQAVWLNQSYSEAASTPEFLKGFGERCTFETDAKIFGYLDLRSRDYHADIHLAYRINENDPGYHHFSIGYAMEDRQMLEMALTAMTATLAGVPLFLSLPFLIKNREFRSTFSSALSKSSFVWTLGSGRAGYLYKPEENANVDIRMKLTKEQVERVITFLEREHRISQRGESIYRLATHNCVEFCVEVLEAVSESSFPMHLFRKPDDLQKPAYKLIYPYGGAYLLSKLTIPVTVVASLYYAYHLYHTYPSR